MAKWQRLGRYEEMMGGNINKVWLEVGGVEILNVKRQDAGLFMQGAGQLCFQLYLEQEREMV